jgi:ubiquinone/menaquinone biosynthesis C-methylase UbiE
MMEDCDKRASLFNTAAIAYDKFRPGYPEQLIDDMLNLADVATSSCLLEVGCGTGKATVQVAKRGYSIDCIDPGANLLELAKKNCKAWPSVRFHHGKFEQADLNPNHYDLIYSAQAFHWIDQNLRWSLCRKYLLPKGAVSVLHNYSPIPHQGTGKELTERLEQITAGVAKVDDHEASIRKWTKEMEQSGVFAVVYVRRYNWIRSFTTEQYIGLFTTFSDFLSMPKGTQEKVANVIQEIITTNGGTYNHCYESVLFEGILC